MYESQGLHHLDPTLPEDDWPLLELTDAIVYQYKAHVQDPDLVDVLSLSELGPFRVKGRLTPSPSANIKNPAVYNTPLILPKVYTYSIEKFPDGRIKIWVLGHAAWYHISPAKEYEKLFETVVKKARLWSFVEEVYAGRGRHTPMDMLYEMYTKQGKSGCKYVIEAKKLVERHHRFLILKMEEQGKWQKTAIWNHMFEEYKKEIAEVRSALLAKKKRYAEQKKKDREQSDGDLEEDEDTEVKVKREPETAVYGKSKSQPIYRRTSSASSASETPKKSRTMSRAAQVKLASTNTLTIRASPRSRTTAATSRRTAYMKGAKNQPATLETPKAIITVKSEPSVSPPPIYSEPATAVRTSKGKSILRPIGAISTTQSSPLCTPSLSPSPPPPSTAARLATLKRKLDSSLDLSHLTKRSRISPPSSESSSSSSPRRQPQPFPPRLVVGALLPTEADKDGIWTCRLGGCGKVVFDADVPAGMAEVEDHYRGHARALGEVMDVVGREAKRKKAEGGFSFLLEKLEGMVGGLVTLNENPLARVKKEDDDDGEEMWRFLS